ncbi:MAG TPA: alpha/beta family hydrolase [Bryobacteraceae bacterium]|nr:alpha/beta family hydrolase [Bryobacteraceae bacterium]
MRISPAHLEGDLAKPDGAAAIVLFAHGSGSSRHSSRNRYVAQILQQSGFATLLLDLLTAEEEQVDLHTRKLRFDILLLAQRLGEASHWLQNDSDTYNLPLGLFGASTGAAAALVTAAKQRGAVRAVVSRGGRPDLAGSALAEVKAPTLLIVGENDEAVVELNREALGRLAAEKKLVIVPHATHLFEEPGALKQVAELAADWFRIHLNTAAAADTGASRTSRR